MCAYYKVLKPALEQEIFQQVLEHVKEVMFIKKRLREIDISAIHNLNLEKASKIIDIYNGAFEQIQAVTKTFG